MIERHVPGKFHPGELLLDELKARGLTGIQFASLCTKIGLSEIYIFEVLRQLKPITKPVAVGIEILLGSHAEEWMNLP